MSPRTIVPQQDNIDIEVNENYVTLSQRQDGNYESVCFHRMFLPAVISELIEVQRQPAPEAKQGEAA